MWEGGAGAAGHSVHEFQLWKLRDAKSSSTGVDFAAGCIRHTLMHSDMNYLRCVLL